MFINSQCIDFYSLSVIDEDFDLQETALNYILRERDINATRTEEFLACSEDLFYSYCGC